jgi:hypothetical protein
MILFKPSFITNSDSSQTLPHQQYPIFTSKPTEEKELKMSTAEIVQRKDTIIFLIRISSFEKLPDTFTSNLIKLYPTHTILIIFISLKSSLPPFKKSQIFK